MSSDTAFARLGVPPPLASSLKAMRFVEPFEIQALTIPDALDGLDILGRAPTGSGKTISFGLPLLARIAKAKPRRPTGLILAPTRELAEQIRRELEPLAKAVKRTTLAVYGGKGITPQRSALSKGVDLLVACPGRLLDLIDQGAVSLNEVQVAVVDEADRMADMGFLPDVSKILDLTPPKRQTMLYSATLDREVQVLVDTYQKNPVEYAVAELEPDLSLLTHRFIQVPKTDRTWLAADLITDLGTTIVFSRTRHGVDRLARQLQRLGVKTGNIHGGRSQSQRDRALDLFVKGKVQALVATDVAARGIHVDGVECVIHYDPPADEKDYVHRSGRTARAGASGVVVSFLDRPQVGPAKKMLKKLGMPAEFETVPERVHFLDSVAAPVNGNRSKKGKPSKSSGKAKSKSRSGGSTSGRTSRRSASAETNEASERETVGSRRPTQRKSGSKPTSKSGKYKTNKSANGRHRDDDNRSESENGSSSGRSDSRSSGKAKARHKGQGSGKSKAAKGRSGRPASKRSGKPRPKNRKNKAGGSRRTS